MSELISTTEDGEFCELHSPTELPSASSFLWNKKMMIQMNCRGYAVAQYMNPGTTKYSHAPNLEAKTFMQPEQPFYAHHPGRFFFVKDEESEAVFSSPYKPCSVEPDIFVFSAGRSSIGWEVVKDGIKVESEITLPLDEALELWSLRIANTSKTAKTLSIYPYFTVGYMSWMNQGARFSGELDSIICTSVSPYQKLDDYFRNKKNKDITFMSADRSPDSWECNQALFEGDAGLHQPAGVSAVELGNGSADYETPACVFQYRVKLEPGRSASYRFLFGPAFDVEEIKQKRQKYLGGADFKASSTPYREYMDAAKGCISISTPDRDFDNFVNKWLPRQVFYHGDMNRLTTDPQTRNYLQDAMGMSYVEPTKTRAALLTALSQQKQEGSMPDGIVLLEDTELTYINQIPHTDHCVWLPLCLRSYLDETGDESLLYEEVGFADSDQVSTVWEHLELAMDSLINARDDRGLMPINQGDWCDPMNMVGYKGIGISGWLTLAAAYSLNEWSAVSCEYLTENNVERFTDAAAELNDAANRELWDGEWYARGITDDGTRFGIKEDQEGRIFLNPQAWGLLSGAATESRAKTVKTSIKSHLETRFGAELLTPAYTAMRDDVGRVTQKFPGSAENGSIYNHAAAFYIYSLYTCGDSDDAFRNLRCLLPGDDDIRARGQLPVFIPNYYRGAVKQYPRTAGRSSQLFNTGTVHWMYRALVDGLFGVRGVRDGLSVTPRLPSTWDKAFVKRDFRGATFNISITRGESSTVSVNGKLLEGNTISDFKVGDTLTVEVVFS